MLENKMKQNDNKTEFMIIGLPGQLKKVTFDGIQIGNSKIIATDNKSRNLGVIFDKEINLKSHVNSMCKSGFYHAKNISSIRDSLDKDTANIAVHVYITSKLDYGNSLLYCLPNILIHKLQLVQNAAAWVVAKIGKYDRITAIKKNLHWLPIKARVEFKNLLLPWKAQHSMAAKILSDLLLGKQYNRNLRTNTRNHLIILKQIMYHAMIELLLKQHQIYGTNYLKAWDILTD